MGVLQNGFGDGLFGGLAGEAVLHETASHLFHRDDGGLLRRGREDGTGTALELAGALGGDDDEAIGALLRIVGQGAVGVVPWDLAVSHEFDTSSNLKCVQNGPDLVLDPGAANALGANDGA